MKVDTSAAVAEAMFSGERMAVAREDASSVTQGSLVFVNAAIWMRESTESVIFQLLVRIYRQARVASLTWAEFLLPVQY
jgi:hypothetical protein